MLLQCVGREKYFIFTCSNSNKVYRFFRVWIFCFFVRPHLLHLKVLKLLRAQAVGEIGPPVEINGQFDGGCLASLVTLFGRVGRQGRLLDDDGGHLSRVRHDHRGRLALVDDQRVQQHCRALPFLVVPVGRSIVHRRRPSANSAQTRRYRRNHGVMILFSRKSHNITTGRQ